MLISEFYNYFQVHSNAMNLCLDQYLSQVNDKVLLWQCHNSTNQFFAFSKSGQITISEGYCIGLKDYNRTQTNGVYVVKCSDTDPMQLWAYDKEVGVT